MTIAFLMMFVVTQLPDIDGSPAVDGNRVTFYAEARGFEPPRIVGDFNGWGRYPDASGPLGGVMVRVDETRWYRATIELTRDARVEYGFSYGDAEPVRDPNNPLAARTFGMVRSAIEMPDYRRSRFVDTAREQRGNVDQFSLADGRTVHVYTPPGYPAAAPYPVVYFNDGSAYVQEVGAPSIVDASIAFGTLAPVVAVFVDPLDRGTEYRGAPTFIEVVIRELVPRIDRDYETLAEPVGRAVVGGSRGALGAFHLAWSAPDVFRYCGMLAPAITPTDLLARVFDQDATPLELFVLGASYDVRFLGDYYNALDTFRAKGYVVNARTAPIGHSPTSWRHYIPEMLAQFFPTRHADHE